MSAPVPLYLTRATLLMFACTHSGPDRTYRLRCFLIPVDTPTIPHAPSSHTVTSGGRLTSVAGGGGALAPNASSVCFALMAARYPGSTPGTSGASRLTSRLISRRCISTSRSRLGGEGALENCRFKKLTCRTVSASGLAGVRLQT
jgi:hypothetical protein